jgi:hypothetical protein
LLSPLNLFLKKEDKNFTKKNKLKSRQIKKLPAFKPLNGFKKVSAMPKGAEPDKAFARLAKASTRGRYNMTFF